MVYASLMPGLLDKTPTAHIMEGFGNHKFAQLPMLEYLLGIALMNSCLPITLYNFMETTCICSLQPESLDHIMLWAACLHNVFSLVFLYLGKLLLPNINLMKDLT